MKDPAPSFDAHAIKVMDWKTATISAVYVLLTILIFLFALKLMLSSLQQMSKTMVDSVILTTTNPLSALFIGLLITAIIQSSTATTSITVALVASGSLTLQSAVPIIMGANIGTTITSTIVSLSFLPQKKEFRRAVAAGSFHDFLNILTATVLFPLEYHFHFLSYYSERIATYLFDQPVGRVDQTSLLGDGLDRITDWLAITIDNGFILVILSLGILFGSIIFFRNLITKLLGIGMPNYFQQFFFQNALKSFGWGILTTATIRSSTVTTSLVVPLVAKKVVKLRRAVPFIAGANVGTTISAFVAATVNSNAAISIAIAHLAFNILGITLFLATPGLRKIPIWLSSGLGRLAYRYRLMVLMYLLIIFFLIPFIIIYFNREAGP